MTARSLITASILALVAGAALFAVPGVPARGQTAGARLSYYADARPILAARCTTCHAKDGIAPLTLDTPATATRAAKAIAVAVSSGRMPPWMPGPGSPAYTEDRRLNPHEKATLLGWVSAGAALGGDRLATPRAARAAGLKPDAVLTPPEPFTPPAGVNDEYRCFLLDPKLTHNRFVTRLNVRPGQPSEVHHVIVYRVPGASLAAAQTLAGQDGRLGWRCFGGPGDGLGSDWLGAWAPGGAAVSMPAGYGALLEAGSLLVMQVHYNLKAGVKADRSSIELNYAPPGANLKPLQTALVAAPVELPCPPSSSGALCDRDAALAELVRRHGPGDATFANDLLAYCGKQAADYALKPGQDGTRLATSCELPSIAGTIFGVAGHMHLRGVSITLEVRPAGGGRPRPLLTIPAWDFHWQSQYWLKTPLKVSAGDRIRVSCAFNNSAGAQPLAGGLRQEPRYVLWGEGTSDEMCLGVITFSPR